MVESRSLQLAGVAIFSMAVTVAIVVPCVLLIPGNHDLRCFSEQLDIAAMSACTDFSLLWCYVACSGERRGG